MKEDLFYQFIQSIIPINENEDPELKQFEPNSIDSSEVTFDITNGLVFLNASLPNLTDFNEGRSIQSILSINHTSQ